MFGTLYINTSAAFKNHHHGLIQYEITSFFSLDAMLDARCCTVPVLVFCIDRASTHKAKPAIIRRTITS